MKDSGKNSGKSYRSILGRVRGLGSAKHGTDHWWMMRVTSLALIPLSLYVLGTFFIYVVYLGGWGGAIVWLHRPVTAACVMLFLAVGFHHAANGLQVVIEDYVHCESAKLFSIITVKFAATLLALLGILFTGRVLFGV